MNGQTSLHRRWPVVFLSIGAALLTSTVWLLLALHTPTTTYHFSALVAVASGPVIARLRSATQLTFLAATRFAFVGGVLTLVTALILQGANAMRGPTLIGSGSPALESIAMIAIGFGVGVALATRGGSREANDA
jgi:hypothetical protein